jgi:peptidyl-prolyl cis-trans isomerase SurA
VRSMFLSVLSRVSWVSGLAVFVMMVTGDIRPVSAQVVSIAAVVNDELVSAYDVKLRQDVILSSAGIKPTKEARRRNRAQVLRTLINEKLQLQEAKRLNITVSSSEIERAKRRIETQNKLQSGTFSDFMRERGLPEAAVIGQLRSEIAWNTVLRRKLNPKIQISDEEVAEVFARYNKSQGLQERQIAEIFLPVDTPKQEAEVASTTRRLVAQMRKGTPFTAIASQFSQSNTARNGGVVGWILEGQLAPELEAALTGMKTGTFTKPIRTPEGYYILFLRGLRRVGVSDPMTAEVTLKQIALPLAKTASDATLQKQMKKANSIAAALRGCDDIDRVAKEIKTPGSGNVGTLKIGELPDKFRNIVSQLKIGQASAPVRTDQGLHVLMVCKRVEAPAYHPTSEMIAQSLGEQRLGMMARRYMRDLRRTAVIDLR